MSLLSMASSDVVLAWQWLFLTKADPSPRFRVYQQSKGMSLCHRRVL
jgi:hypothetical protein